MPKRTALKAGQFTEVPDSEVDFDFLSPNQHLGTHANLIPLQSAVQSGRVFYGARFANQALPVNNNEAPLVQLAADNDPQGRSFDDILGESAGALRAKEGGTVHAVGPDKVTIRTSDNRKVEHHLHNRFPFNRKTELHQTPTVMPGQIIKPGQLVAKSNFTDPNGTLALGINGRVGLVAYKGHSMDDAVVISEGFAKRLSTQQLHGYDLDYKRGVKGGKSHYMGVFPNRYTNKQLDMLDDEGVVKPGMVLNPGDPMILATRPRVISSTNAQLGLLSKHMRNARGDAAVLWDGNTPGTVVDVARTSKGVRLNVHAQVPTDVGDKIVLRSGQKGTVSKIIPDEHMPRTADGQPLEMLLNHQGIPSRVNPSLVYELLLGKIAKKTGKPYKLPAFNKPGESWNKFVRQELTKHGLTDTEDVFDPILNRKLDNPITVGNGYILALHHTSHSKTSARGQGAYNADEQPAHGGGEMAQSKRLSGLESSALMSAGAYNVLREGATLRGTRSDEYWRMLRQGYEPKEPGSPFVWDKFKALLQGAGYHSRRIGGGKERLQFLTDRDLAKLKPLSVKTGDIVDINTLEPIPGGLFDPAITGSKGWAAIDLPHPVVNPAAEEVVRKMLGLTEKDFRSVMAGEMELPEHLRKKRTVHHPV